MKPFLKIVASSYEGSLFGWQMAENPAENKLDTVFKFGFSVSPSCLKVVAVSKSGKYLVTGGVDERIRIFNAVENKAIGELVSHSGGITSLQFFNDSFLISSSEDCTLCIWRVSDWQCVHILGGHKEPVTDFSIHPSGKLAFSISKDSTMKLWNLVQGRCAFTRRLRKAADKVLWHESGLFYMLIAQTELQLYQASDNCCKATISLSSRINSGVFTSVASLDLNRDDDSNWRIAVICEDKSLKFYNFCGCLTLDISMATLDIGRPRNLWSCYPDLSTITSDEMHTALRNEGQCLVICTSSGYLTVFSSRTLEDKEIASTSGSSTDDGTKTALNYAMLTCQHIKVEPRLTSVVAWSSNLS